MSTLYPLDNVIHFKFWRLKLFSITYLSVNNKNRTRWRSSEHSTCVIICEKIIKIVLSLTEMASSSFTDAPNADSFDPENKSVTIVINDNGEINYDEKTLQSIIGKSSNIISVNSDRRRQNFWMLYCDRSDNWNLVFRVLEVPWRNRLKGKLNEYFLHFLPHF